MMMKNKIGEY